MARSSDNADTARWNSLPLRFLLQTRARRYRLLGQRILLDEAMTALLYEVINTMQGQTEKLVNQRWDLGDIPSEFFMEEKKYSTVL
jgi:hypothetical protein